MFKCFSSAFALAAVLVCGCSNGPKSRYPIKAETTTGMVADLVKHVGGPHVNVDQLMKAGVDPHLYKAAPEDISRLEQADGIFYSGLNLEGKMGDVFVRLAGRGKPTCPVAAGIPSDQVLEVDEGHYDPHVWFDVSIWSQAVEVVAAELAKMDPAHGRLPQKL